MKRLKFIIASIFMCLFFVSCKKTPKYTITWVNHNGSVLEIDEEVEEGVIPTYDGISPTRETDEQYTYTFKGWDKNVEPASKNITYTASFDATLRQYTITFLNDDDSLIQKTNLDYGTLPSFNTSLLTSKISGQEDYEFAGWDKELVVVTKDATYKATFDKFYTITFVNDDGSLLKTSKVAQNTLPVYDLENPTKASDNTYNYSFGGWDKEIVVATKDVTYKALFNKTFIDYTVKFLNVDNSVISETVLHYGDEIVVPTATYSDKRYTYEFKGWDKQIPTTCNGELIVKATYNTEPIYYTVIFLREDGSTIQTEQLLYGSTPVLKVEIPEKTSTYTSYEFGGYDHEVVSVDSEATYKITYRPLSTNLDVFNYSLNETGDGYIINGIKDEYKTYLDGVAIPEEINGIKVIEIGKEAFSGNSYIKQLRISKNILTIREKGIYSSSVNEIYFAEGSQLEVIESYGLAYNSLLSKINLPTTIKRIYRLGMCDNNQLKGELYLPNIEYVGDWFIASTQYSKVIFGQKIQTFVYGAFESNGLTEYLKEIAVEGEGKYYVKDYGFYRMIDDSDSSELLAYPRGRSDTTFTIDDKCVSIVTYAFYGAARNVKVIAGENLEVIQAKAFRGAHITEFVGNDKLKLIETEAFYMCSNLTKISLGSNLREVGKNAFMNTNSLSQFNLDSNNQYLTYKNSCLIRNDTKDGNVEKVLIAIIGAGNSDLYIPEGIVRVENALSYINITTLHIPSSLIDLGNYNDIMIINTTSNLKMIYVDENNPVYSSEDGILYNKDKTILLKVPDHYQVEILTIKDGIKEIVRGAISNISGIKTVTLPTSVEHIRADAFLNAYTVTKIEYAGTRLQWQDVDAFYESPTSSYLRGTYISTIYCSDGPTNAY